MIDREIIDSIWAIGDSYGVNVPDEMARDIAQALNPTPEAANTIEAMVGALRKARPIVAGAAMITASAAEKRAPGAAEIAAEDAALLVEIDEALALTSTDKPEVGG